MSDKVLHPSQAQKKGSGKDVPVSKTNISEGQSGATVNIPYNREGSGKTK